MILFLAINDWANVGYTLASSLKSINVDAIALKSKNHALQYPGQGQIYTNTIELKTITDKCNVIVWMHSKFTPINTTGKKLFVFHGGSEYRKNYNQINKKFNPIVCKSIIQTGDLLGLGAKDEQWLLPPIDTELLQPVFEPQNNKLTIGHYPRDTKVKGSVVINSIIHKLQNNTFIYLFSKKRQKWSDNIKRISNCDIYIDALCPVLNGRPYGEWGIQTLEAAALGKIVITHFQSYKRYAKEYGSCALQYVNTPKELENKLKMLIQLSPDKILQLKRQTRKWVETTHSFKTVGCRLKKILGV